MGIVIFGIGFVIGVVGTSIYLHYKKAKNEGKTEKACKKKLKKQLKPVIDTADVDHEKIILDCWEDYEW